MIVSQIPPIRSVGVRFAKWSHHDHYQSTINALGANVVILAPDAEIIAVNDAWAQFADTCDLGLPDYGVGANYLDLCDALLSTDDAQVVAAGLNALLDGGVGPFRHEFPMHARGGVHWCRLSAVRVGEERPPRLIASHEDISARRSAEEALREATARLLHAEDDERRRIARELHDSTAQHLVGAKLMLKRLQAYQVPGLAELSDEIGGLLSEALGEIRSLTYLLHPPTLEHLGLAAAIRQFVAGFADRTRMTVELDIAPDFPRICQAAEIALYRVVQEALANAQRHSGGQRARIELGVDGDMVRLCIRDYGVGLALGPALAAGVGLEGMRLRLKNLNGQLTLRNADPGLAVDAYAPLRIPGE